MCCVVIVEDEYEDNDEYDYDYEYEHEYEYEYQEVDNEDGICYLLRTVPRIGRQGGR